MKNERIAVYAGSFCPFTKGHEDIVKRACPLFDKIYIAIGNNNEKHNVFTLEERIFWISKLYENDLKIDVFSYDGLTIDFCNKINAKFLIRGVRNGYDLSYEQNIAEFNRQINPNIETIIFMSSPETMFISSTMVRELWMNHADYSKFISYELPEYKKNITF